MNQEENGLASMALAGEALEILSAGGGERAEKTVLCICCANAAVCPNQGKKFGLCERYRLNEALPNLEHLVFRSLGAELPEMSAITSSPG